MRGSPQHREKVFVIRHPHARDPPSFLNCSALSSTPHARIHPKNGRRKMEHMSTRMRGSTSRHQRASLLLSTPHARGSTRTAPALTRLPGVYPACAGIHLRHIDGTLITVSLPRMRGDPPLSATNCSASRRSTPHARGSTRKRCSVLTLYRVYPACAGIHRLPLPTLTLPSGLPRMRGDPPSSKSL